MKRLLPLLLLLMALAPLHAQNFVATPKHPAQKVTTSTSDESNNGKPSISGIVTAIFLKKPWQAINPAAPASYGTGEKLVSKDESLGTPYHSTCLIVAGVEW